MEMPEPRWWFQIFLVFTLKIGEMIQFDLYFSNGLVQPPTIGTGLLAHQNVSN